MAFAIYYFKDNTVEVGKTSLWTGDLQQCEKSITQCPKLDDEDGWMDVKWMKGKKKSDGPAYFPAKVLLFGGKLWIFCFSVALSNDLNSLRRGIFGKKHLQLRSKVSKYLSTIGVTFKPHFNFQSRHPDT